MEDHVDSGDETNYNVVHTPGAWREDDDSVEGFGEAALEAVDTGMYSTCCVDLYSCCG
jgi:hypothetical protein